MVYQRWEAVTQSPPHLPYQKKKKKKRTWARLDPVDTIIPIKYFSDFHHSGKALRMILIYLAEDSGQGGHFPNYEKYQTFSFHCLWLSTRSALPEEIWSWQKAQAGEIFENTSLTVLSRLFLLQLMDPQKRREASCCGSCLSLQTLGGWNGRIFSSRSPKL